MYQIQPYDFRKSFRLIPDRQYYSVLFYIGKNVTFSNKNKALDFIASVNSFYNEVLGVCEMLSLYCSNYQYHIRPQRKAHDDNYKRFSENQLTINQLLSDIIISRRVQTTIAQLTRKIIQLISTIERNFLILRHYDKNCADAQLIIIQNLKNAFNYIIDNVFELYTDGKLSLFKF